MEVAALFTKLQAVHKSEAEQQAVVRQIQQYARHGCHTAAVVQALLASHPDTSQSILHGLLDLAMSASHSHALMSSSCAASCQALAVAISCCPLVEDDLQQQLLKAFLAAEHLLLAGLEHGSPAAKKLAAQIGKQLCGQAVGRRRTTGISTAWLEALIAALGMEQAAGTAAAPAARPAVSNNQQMGPDVSAADALLEAIQCVSEHTLTNGQLCQRTCRTAGQCSCSSCKQLSVINLKPLLRALRHGNSNAIVALRILAGTTGVQRQLATQPGIAELLSIAWEHKNTAAGLAAVNLLCQLVQNSSLAKQALQQHIEVIVLALEQVALLSPTDLTQTLVSCLALLAIAAAPDAMDPNMVQQLHEALGRCIPCLVQLAEYSIVQHPHNQAVQHSSAPSPAAAARVLLQAVADHHKKLLAGALAKHDNSLHTLLAAANSIETTHKVGVSAAGGLLLAATAGSTIESTDLLLALNKQPHITNLVQQLKGSLRTAAALAARVAVLDSLDAAWLQQEMLQQLLEIATRDVKGPSCTVDGKVSTAAYAAKALLATAAAKKADVLAAKLVQHPEFLLGVLKAAEAEGSQVGFAGSLLLGATASSTLGSEAPLAAVGHRPQCMRGILQLVCTGNRTAALLVCRMSAQKQLDAVLLQRSRLQQLLAAALPVSAPSEDVSSCALKAVWALFSRETAQKLMNQLPLQQLLKVVQALALEAGSCIGGSAGSRHAKMAALNMDIARCTCDAAASGQDSIGEQLQTEQGICAALQLVQCTAAEAHGAVAAAWQVLLRLSRSSQGCESLTSGKTGGHIETAVSMLMRQLAQTCSITVSCSQPGTDQVSRDALLKQTLAADSYAAAVPAAPSADTMAAAVLAGLAETDPQNLTTALQQDKQQQSFRVILQVMFGNTDASVAQHACRALQQMTAGPHAQQQAAVECMRGCGAMLVELMQQGWVAAAQLFAFYAKVSSGQQGCQLVQHVLGLEQAARSSNAEVAATATAMLQGLPAQDCCDHIDQLMQWMQQGSGAAAQLLMQVAQLPAAPWTSCHLGELIQWMQQGSDAAAHLLPQVVQMPAGKQQLLQQQHVTALVAAAGHNAAVERVLQELMVPECLANVSGTLVQLLQQGTEATVVARVLLRLMQLHGGKQAVLQHLLALVLAAESSVAAVQAAAASVLHVLAVPECIPHLEQLMQLMQQGRAAAAELVTRLYDLPAARPALMQRLPALLPSVSANGAVSTAAVALIFELVGCTPRVTSAADHRIAKAAQESLAQLDLMPLLHCITRGADVAAMSIAAFNAAAPNMADTATGIAALQRYISQLLKAAAAVAASGNLCLAQQAADAASAIASYGKGGSQAALACLPELAAAVGSCCNVVMPAALNMLQALLRSTESKKQAAVLQEVAKQQTLTLLVQHLRVSAGAAVLLLYMLNACFMCGAQAPSSSMCACRGNCCR
jgi:hypothetical protein